MRYKCVSLLLAVLFLLPVSVVSGGHERDYVSLYKPSIVVDGSGHVHMVWQDVPEGEADSEIYYTNDIGHVYLDVLMNVSADYSVTEMFLERAIEAYEAGEWAKSFKWVKKIAQREPEEREALAESVRAVVFCNLLGFDSLYNDSRLEKAWRLYFLAVRSIEPRYVLSLDREWIEYLRDGNLSDMEQDFLERLKCRDRQWSIEQIDEKHWRVCVGRDVFLVEDTGEWLDVYYCPSNYAVYFALMQKAVRLLMEVDEVSDGSGIVRVSYTENESFEPYIMVRTTHYGRKYESYVAFEDVPDTIHIGWFEYVNGSKTVFYARSTNNGQTWWYMDAVEVAEPYLRYVCLSELLDNMVYETVMGVTIASASFAVVDGCHTLYGVVVGKPISELPDSDPWKTVVDVVRPVDDPCGVKYPYEYYPISVSGGMFWAPVEICKDPTLYGEEMVARPGAVASPNLVVASIDVTPPPQEDKETTVYTTIKNVGSCAISGTFYVAFLKDNVILNEIKVEHIAVGEEIILSSSWVPSKGGRVKIKVIVDSRDDVREGCEGDNEKISLEDVQPRYAISLHNIETKSEVVEGHMPLYMVEDGLRVWIKNDGWDSITVKVRFHGAGESLIDEIQITVPGEGEIATSAVRWAHWTPEMYGPSISITAWVAYPEDVQTSITRYLTIGIHNLKAESLSVETYYGFVIQDVSTIITAYVKNDGDGDAKNLAVRFEAYNADTGIKIRDIGTETVSFLPKGETTAVTITWTPLQGIRYLIKVIVDALEKFAERNEADNVIDHIQNVLPHNGDYDSDGLNNYEERHEDAGGTGTNPNDPDTDDDGLNDGPEKDYWDSISVNAWHTDYDGDGIENNLKDADADSDSLNDGTEVNGWSITVNGNSVHVTSLPYQQHSDADGLRDDGEKNTYGTDPMNVDTDGDGLNDDTEINGWYITVNGNSVHVTSDPRTIHSDGDGLTDSQEYSPYGTDPRKDDTDDDTLNDYEESILGTNPTQWSQQTEVLYRVVDVYSDRFETKVVKLIEEEVNMFDNNIDISNIEPAGNIKYPAVGCPVLLNLWETYGFPVYIDTEYHTSWSGHLWHEETGYIVFLSFTTPIHDVTSDTWMATAALQGDLSSIPEGLYSLHVTTHGTATTDHVPHAVHIVHEVGTHIKFVQITDTHIGDGEGDNGNVGDLRAIINRLNKLEQPDFIVITGDLTDNAFEDETKYFKACILESELPTFLTPGNHDYTAWGWGLEDYCEWLNPSIKTDPNEDPNYLTDYSFDYGDYHFIVFDSGRREYMPLDSRRLIGLTDAQLNWIESDYNAYKYGMDMMGKEPHCFVLTHGPIAGSELTNGQGIDHTHTQNDEEFVDWVNGGINIEAVFCGHTHEDHIFYDVDTGNVYQPPDYSDPEDKNYVAPTTTISLPYSANSYYIETNTATKNWGD